MDAHSHRAPGTLIRIWTLSSIAIFLSGCGSFHVTPESTKRFENTEYVRYAWRSDPPSQSSFTKDLTTRKSGFIRRGVEESMTELGYELVDKSEAEFFIEYFAASGFNEGQLAYGGSNEGLYGSSVNRQIDGASADNAQLLSDSLLTSGIQLLFIDASSNDVLWRVEITMVVEDANRIDEDQVKEAVRQGLLSLPDATDGATR